MSYKVFVATKGQPNLREAEFGSEDWINAHNMLEEPLDPQADVTMVSNNRVSVDEAYVFADSYDMAMSLAYNFIYDEPSETDKVLNAFWNEDGKQLAEALDELPYPYTFEMIENEEGRALTITDVSNIKGD